jgi:putative ABC transport system substrate-binding protein
MKRRDFLTLLGGAAAGWPLAARGQQGALPLVGYLHPAPRDAAGIGVVSFVKGLVEAGFSEGRNVAIEYRFGENQPERLPGLAAELVGRRVRVIAALGNAALAAQAATTTIPIVFGTNGDPVEMGLVPSLSRPGKNLTGVTFLGQELAPKRLSLLHELVPRAKRFAVLVDPASPNRTIEALQVAASTLGVTADILEAGSNREIDTAFANAAKNGIEGVLVSGSTLFNNRRQQLATLAARHVMPVIYYDRVFPEAGGLMSYGSNILDQYRQIGVYAGRILKGERAADLPVMQPTKFELVINLQTARALDLTVSPSLLSLADEVIE